MRDIISRAALKIKDFVVAFLNDYVAEKVRYGILKKKKIQENS